MFNSTCNSKNHPSFSRISLNELAFDPTNVKKHGLTYIALSYI
jgi:hypothetical protein